TRFQIGLAIDIKQPDLEHRVTILKRKLEESISDGKTVTDECLEYIATNFSNNVRELEGALRRVLSYCVIMNLDADFNNAKEALAALLKNKTLDGSEDKYENVKSVVSSFYNITVEDLEGKKRTNNIIIPRHIVMYILKNSFNLPYKQIGKLLGNRDHSTVIAACAKIEDEMKVDEKLNLAITTITRKINS
ncbi:MAG: helix-turn-helix domain-containing protein, partial [Anaeroplasmataceae bacterium]